MGVTVASVGLCLCSHVCQQVLLMVGCAGKIGIFFHRFSPKSFCKQMESFGLINEGVLC